jgi:NAD(P)-dependent dehydrogenase (short-subunit alcohol dehydrogenase family)
MNVVIVGCGNVGLETARRLCRDHSLLIVSRRRTGDVEDLIRAHGNVSFALADATDAEAMTGIVADFVDRAGRVDAIVSTVGAFDPASVVDDFASFESNFTLNVFANLTPIRAVLKYMIGQRSGKIVVLSSTSGVFAYRGLTAYVPAKWALTSLCTTLRRETAQYGVSVDVVFPASIRNERSRTFLYERGLAPGTVAAQVCRAIHAKRGADHFVPRHKALLRPLERMSPQVLDRRAGLKSRRAARFRNRRVGSVLIAGASSGLREALARLYAESAERVCVAGDESMDRIVADMTPVDLLVIVGSRGPTGWLGDASATVLKNSLKTSFLDPVKLMTGLLHRNVVTGKIAIVLCSSSLKGRRACGGCSAGHAAMRGFTRALRRTIGNDTQVMEVGVDLCPAVGTQLSETAIAQRIVQSERTGREIVSLAL